ncbi:MAG: phosphoribosylanthranilate isomerase [Povalibacter sp.]
MSIWVKICGLTTEEGVTAAVQAGADAIGFVFAPSKRQVTAHEAKRLASLAPRLLKRVAVMLHPSQAQLDEVCEVFAPDVLQTDAEDLLTLRVPSHLALMPVFRDASELPTSIPARLLFEGAVSGAGLTADWSRAASWASRTQIVLAGGLNGSNVVTAIRSVRPFGVDVSSGVERAPGVKDANKISEFVQAARVAAEQL